MYLSDREMAERIQLLESKIETLDAELRRMAHLIGHITDAELDEMAKDLGPTLSGKLSEL